MAYNRQTFTDGTVFNVSQYNELCEGIKELEDNIYSKTVTTIDMSDVTEDVSYDLSKPGVYLVKNIPNLNVSCVFNFGRCYGDNRFGKFCAYNHFSDIVNFDAMSTGGWDNSSSLGIGDISDYSYMNGVMFTIIVEPNYVIFSHNHAEI